MWAVDGEGTGDWNWPQPEEDKPEGSIGSVERSTEKINIDEEGYETVRRPRQRTLGQYMPEIFAVEAEKPGKGKKAKVRNEEKPTKNLCEKFCGRKCRGEGVQPPRLRRKDGEQ